ncbi:hypothetical protein D5E69_23035 (plasmid) [Rossellomorea marisflavi]|jgi:hypothetical protein|uniref:hypothetical protein n=1 Tax=Rossellomorea marisflavi TaxID=189381 RepID=UPI0013195C99|nr:hypothetical protein [Rossellomorea marisflavi]QHA38711.1 hypothetical protein D5E69_23035 [Rossellomorea marisflavi]
MPYQAYCVNEDSSVREKDLIDKKELSTYVEENKNMMAIHILNESGNVELIFRKGKLSFIDNPYEHDWLKKYYKRNVN